MSRSSLKLLFAVVLGCAFFLGFSAPSHAFQYSSLPSDNLIKNPWFHQNCQESLANWDTTPNAEWLSRGKTQNPIDVNCVVNQQSWHGFSARFAREGQNEPFIPNQDAKLWQIVGPVNPNDRTLQYHALFVAHRVNEYSAKIYGSNNPSSNQWTLVWTPLNIKNCLSVDCVNNKTGACNSGNRQCLWAELAKIYYGSVNPISMTIPQGYTYYKIEFLMNYPDPNTSLVTGDVGGKLTRVYFNVKPASGGTTVPGNSSTPTPPPTNTVTPIPTSGVTSAITPKEMIEAQCNIKRALKNGEQITQIQVGEEFTYELRISPSNHTGASVSDPIPEGLSVIASSLPSYCSASGNVLGASVVRTNLSNIAILLILITIVWMGGTGYLIVRYVKMEETEEMKIGKKVISKKQLKQILTVEMGVAVILMVIVVGQVVRERRAAPEDSSAATGTTVRCNEVPGGETRVRFNVKAVSGNGSVTNKATIVSGKNSSTCEHSITIIGLDASVEPTEIVDPTETVEPTETTTPSQTPSITPTGTTVPGGTNTPIPSQTPVAPTNTTAPTTPGAPSLPQPTPTIQPTPGVGIACGKADVNNDGKFTLVDFRDFAKIYQRECNDGHLDYGECGHKDSDRNGKIEIRDFQSFAGRYAPRESCALP